MKKSLLLLLVFTLMASMFLVGCAPTETEEPADTEPVAEDTKPEPEPVDDNPALARGNVLTVATGSLDGRFNPILSGNLYDSWVNSLIFDSLISGDPAGNVIPNAAHKWEVSEDKLTYTFFLKEGMKFHDGEEVTAEDVAFTFYTIAHPDYTGPRGSVVNDMVGVAEYRELNGDDDPDNDVTDIEGITVIDDYTISFTINEPNVKKIRDFWPGILPKHYYDFTDYEDFVMLLQNPMGSGMFKFHRYLVGQYVEVRRFDDYHGDKPEIEGVIIRLMPSETQAAAVSAGVVDLANPSANLENFEIMSESGFANVQEFLGNSYRYIGFNLRLDKFQDRRTRAALFYGLNLADFIETEWEGFASPAFSPISPVSWAAPKEGELIEYHFNPEKAKELLAEAGWADTDGDGYLDMNGERFTITWTAYDDVSWPVNLIAVAKSNWGDLGIELIANLMEFNAVVELVYDDQDFEIYNMGWSLAIDPDPTSIFGPDADVPGGFNSIGFHHERAHEIFRLALLEYDQEKRAELYREWARIANYELPYIFVSIGNRIWGVNRRVHGMELGPFYGWVANIDNIKLDYTE
ncbi:MAG: ABC transporter substrate-binding protein [Alkaliphilus sp.]